LFSPSGNERCKQKKSKKQEKKEEKVTRKMKSRGRESRRGGARGVHENQASFLSVKKSTPADNGPEGRQKKF